MSDKNNIEDFFNRSMDGFDGEPSDAVWQGLSARMQAEQPFWKKALFRWLTLGLLFWLISFGAYRHYLLTEMELLMTNNKSISVENQNLQKALADCSAVAKSENNNATTTALLAETNESQTTITDTKQAQRTFGYTTPAIGKYPQAPVYSYLSANAIAQQLNTFLNNHKAHQEELISAGKKAKLYHNSADVAHSTPSDFPMGYVPSEEHSNAQKQLNAGIISTAIDSIEVSDMEVVENNNPVTKLSAIQKVRLISISEPQVRGAKISNQKVNQWYRALPATLVLQQQLKLKETYDFRPSLRVGFSGGLFTTFTDLNSSFKGHFNEHLKTNYDAAFTMQWQLFRRIALTTEMGYNWQVYEESVAATEQNNVSGYPRAESLNAPIQQVEVTNQYIDLPVGLKFNFGGRRSARSFYCNPGVAWQMWLPQQFNYKTADASNLQYQEDRFFLYFGTAFLNLGMEYQLSDKIHWNIGLSAERSLVDYGLEDRQFVNLGFKTGVLFGR